jgi:hypothetical protein
MLAFAVFSFFHCNLELIPLQQKVLENAHTVPSWVQTEKKQIETYRIPERAKECLSLASAVVREIVLGDKTSEIIR